MADRSDAESQLPTPGIQGNVPMPRSVTYIDHEDPFVLADQGSGDPNLRKLTQNAWVSCGGSVYVLECMGKGYIRITPIESNSDEGAENEEDAGASSCAHCAPRSIYISPGAMFTAHYTAPTLAKSTAWALKISPYRKSKKILTATTLSDAIRGCDTYAQKEILPGGVSRGLLRNARWRWEPASESQKKFVLKAWKGRKVVTAPNGLGRALPATEEGLRALKKGEAANLITRLKHGALVSPFTCVDHG